MNTENMLDKNKYKDISNNFLWSLASFSLLLTVDNFYCSSFKFTDSFLCPFHSTVDFLYLIYFFSVLKCLFGTSFCFIFFCLYFPFLSWELLDFNLFQVCLLLVKVITSEITIVMEIINRTGWYNLNSNYFWFFFIFYPNW